MMNVSVDGNCILPLATAEDLLCSSRYTCTTRVLGIGTTAFDFLRFGIMVVDGGAGVLGASGDDARISFFFGLIKIGPGAFLFGRISTGVTDVLLFLLLFLVRGLLWVGKAEVEDCIFTN